jgi:hypothetical protein
VREKGGEIVFIKKKREILQIDISQTSTTANTQDITKNRYQNIYEPVRDCNRINTWSLAACAQNCIDHRGTKVIINSVHILCNHGIVQPFAAYICFGFTHTFKIYLSVKKVVKKKVEEEREAIQPVHNLGLVHQFGESVQAYSFTLVFLLFH